MTNVLKLTIPDEKNLYFVGDIHGAHDLYQRALNTFDITKDDVVVSVGDMIDRGNKSAKTLFEFLFQENRYATMGNHCAMCLYAEFDAQYYNIWYNHGGKEFTDEVGVTGVQYFRQYLNQLPLVIEVTHRGKKFGVVHAGVPLKYTHWDDVLNSANSFDAAAQDDFLWSTSTFDYCTKNNVPMARRLDGIDYVFSGHSAVHDPLVYGNRIWIDSIYYSGEPTLAYFDGNIFRYHRRDRDNMSFKRPGYKGK